MSGIRDEERSGVVDGMFLDLDEEDLESGMDEDDLVAMVGQGGPRNMQEAPNQSYGGTFSNTDGMVVNSENKQFIKVEDENWRIVGNNVVFDRAASETKESNTVRLIKPEEVAGARTEGAYVPLNKRNLTRVASEEQRMWVVPREAEDPFGGSDMIMMGD